MLIWVTTLAAGLIGVLWLSQRRLIYLPGRRVPPVEAVLPGWAEVTLGTADGLRLDAWYRPPDPHAPVIIVFNGNAGTRADRAPLGARLARQGLGVLLTDYRGYGGNPGHPTESGLGLDARAAVAFAEERAARHPVVYYGESLGAAVAIELAAARPPDALVLRSPFTSLGDAAAVHYPLLPVRAMLWDRYPSADRIGTIDAPVLVVAGSDDSIIPTTQSRTIYELAAGPKELLIVDGADHNDFDLLAGEALVAAVVRFSRSPPAS